jgi:hypothetical protein
VLDVAVDSVLIPTLVRIIRVVVVVVVNVDGCDVLCESAEALED